MKRILAFILVVVFVFALTGCRAKNTKSDIFTLVEENYDAILKACEEKDEDAAPKTGDSANVMLYAVSLVAALMAIVAVLKRRNA